MTTVKRRDRVYCVACDHLGQRVAIGGRDREAVVYAVSQGNVSSSRSVDMIFSASFNKPIHSVALSADGKQLAVGNEKLVCLFNVNTKMLKHQLAYGGLVHSVAYAENTKHLAIGGAHTSVDIWALPGDGREQPTRVLALPCRGEKIPSVAFPDSSLCFVSDSMATMYGMANRECGWVDRPSFEVIADMINHPTALTTTVQTHPYVLNATNPISGESLLQYIVRGQNMEQVELMLSANCRLGLMQDNQGHTALKTGLKLKQKQVVRLLLWTMVKSMEETPSALEPFIRHKADIANQYPDLFLEFIKTIKLLHEESLTPTGQKHGTAA